MDNYAYNGFPATYQPNYYYSPTATQPIYNPRNWQQYNTTAVTSYQQQQTQNNNQQVNNNSMVWVQGEAGAKAYVLPPNTTLPLWDSEAQVIYIKSVDISGKPTMTILDYVDRNAPTEVDSVQTEYATKEQVEMLNSQFTAINDKLAMLSEFVTKDQLDFLNTHLDDLGSQIEDIENRITSFGKSQQASATSNRRGNK